MRVKVRVYEAEEGGFWAVVPGIPNCVSEGETLRVEKLAGPAGNITLTFRVGPTRSR